MMESAFKKRPALLGFAVLLYAAPGFAQSITGVYVPELEIFDNLMYQFMDDNDIPKGVLGVSVNGCIVYQRGFNTPENTPFRLASVEKPITAAAIRNLAADPSSGLASDLSDPVFNGGLVPFNNGGVLSHTPYRGIVGDNRLAKITIGDLLGHQGGWDNRGAGPGPCLGCTECVGCDDCQKDPQFAEIEIACAMSDDGITSPPGRDLTIRYMLTQPLQFCPGVPFTPASGMCPPGCGGSCPNACNNNVQNGGCYSNFGYMLLGRVIEEVSGYDHFEYIRRAVLTPNLWVPSTEIFFGRTFPNNRDLREPGYTNCDMCGWHNVFQPQEGAFVPPPDGGWDHESFAGHGNLVASAAPLLVFMDNYQVANGGIDGTALSSNGPSGCTTDCTNSCNHRGKVVGSSTVIWQRSDGINIVVLFNKDGSPHLAGTIVCTINNAINQFIADGNSWPTLCVDGFWVHLAAQQPSFFGSYDQPHNSIDNALQYRRSGSKLRFQPGATAWTGTLATRMRLDAPFGPVTIGRQ